MSTIEEQPLVDHYRACPLCEASCGLEVTTRGDTVVRVRGDRDNPFSRGYICPKGASLGKLHADPDRLRAPLVRDTDAPRGFREVSWDEAFAEVQRVLMPVLEEHGRDSLAMVIGNPTTHHTAPPLYGRPLIKAAGTKNIYSASTVDQMPAHVAAGLMWGDAGAFPLPDIDRTDHLLMLGANPWASNGSLVTAPDFPGRVEAIRERGGRVVVVDPRRTETAEHADEHIAIQPGTDAFWLAAVAQTLVADDLVDLGRLAPHIAGFDRFVSLVSPFTPEAVADRTGITADITRRQARDLAAATTAAVYGRIGTHTVEFGTVAAWLASALSILTGNFDRAGGVMTSSPAHTKVDLDRHPGGREFRLGRWESRVKSHPEVRGEFPAATLADEMETPGRGQVRAAITHASNPVRSYPNSDRLDAAFAGLDAMVSIDIYVNETTRHADVILPPPGPLDKSFYDLAFSSNAVRTFAQYAPPVFENDGPLEEDILARLVLVLSGAGADGDPSAVHDMLVGGLLDRELANDASPIHGRDRDEILAELEPLTPAERLVDLMVRCGWKGDGFGADPDGLSIEKLRANPHGIDEGPLIERFPARLRTASGMLELAPEPLAADIDRLRSVLEEPVDADRLLLIGRRHVRSNNSWMHNVEVLVKGKPRCTLLVNPADASRLGLVDGASAEVSSRVGTVVAPVELSDSMMVGVVSLPHGWGHDVDGVWMDVAKSREPGVNSNALTDDALIDPLSGNAVLNGIPVSVTAA